MSFLEYHTILLDQPPFGSVYIEIHSANIYLMPTLCQSLTAQGRTGDGAYSLEKETEMSTDYTLASVRARV